MKPSKFRRGCRHQPPSCWPIKAHRNFISSILFPRVEPYQKLAPHAVVHGHQHWEAVATKTSKKPIVLFPLPSRQLVGQSPCATGREHPLSAAGTTGCNDSKTKDKFIDMDVDTQTRATQHSLTHYNPRTKSERSKNRRRREKR